MCCGYYFPEIDSKLRKRAKTQVIRDLLSKIKRAGNYPKGIKYNYSLINYKLITTTTTVFKFYCWTLNYKPPIKISRIQCFLKGLNIEQNELEIHCSWKY